MNLNASLKKDTRFIKFYETRFILLVLMLFKVAKVFAC